MFGYTDDDPLRAGMDIEAEFRTVLRCEFMAEGNRTTGKLILPMSCLERLASTSDEYPMLFRVTNMHTKRSTHAGVLEFTAVEGTVLIPEWLKKTIEICMSDRVLVERVMLPRGQFVKLQPQSVDFLEISDPKAVLENALVNFPAISKDDLIVFFYNSKRYEIRVIETRPNFPGISIADTDLEVDFEAPLDYVEPPPLNPLDVADRQSALNIRRLVGESSLFSHKLKKPNGIRVSGRKVKQSVPLPVPGVVDAPPELDPGAVLNLKEGQYFFGFLRKQSKQTERERASGGRDESK